MLSKRLSPQVRDPKVEHGSEEEEGKQKLSLCESLRPRRAESVEIKGPESVQSEIETRRKYRQVSESLGSDADP